LTVLHRNSYLLIVVDTTSKCLIGIERNSLESIGILNPTESIGSHRNVFWKGTRPSATCRLSRPAPRFAQNFKGIYSDSQELKTNRRNSPGLIVIHGNLYECTITQMLGIHTKMLERSRERQGLPDGPVPPLIATHYRGEARSEENAPNPRTTIGP